MKPELSNIHAWTNETCFIALIESQLFVGLSKPPSNNQIGKYYYVAKICFATYCFAPVFNFLI